MHPLASYPIFNCNLSPALNPSYSCLASFSPSFNLIFEFSSFLSPVFQFHIPFVPSPNPHLPVTHIPAFVIRGYKIVLYGFFFQRKCDKYWPEEGLEQHGNIAVKHLNTFSRAHYTVRMFSLKDTKAKKVCSHFVSLSHYKYLLLTVT